MKTELTQEFVDTATVPKGKKHIVYYDGACPSLSLRVQKSRRYATAKDSRSFFLDGYGKKYRRLGNANKISLARARKLAEHYKKVAMSARFNRVGVHPRAILTNDLVERIKKKKISPICATHPKIIGFYLGKGSPKTNPHNGVYYYARQVLKRNLTVSIGGTAGLCFSQAEKCAAELSLTLEMIKDGGFSFDEIKARLRNTRDDFFRPKANANPAWAA